MVKVMLEQGVLIDGVESKHECAADQCVAMGWSDA